MGCPPAPVYKGAKGERCGQPWGAPGGVLLPPGVGLPPFPSWIRTWEGETVEEKKEGGRRPPLLVLFVLGGGARGTALASSPLFHLGPLSYRGVPVTSPYSEKYPNHSEPFRSPNIVVQYIDLYVSAISRLLVMSPISSGTPNYLGYIKTHKLIIQIIIER